MTDREEELLNRAFAAYYRSGGGPMPALAYSGVEVLDGLYYVVLRDRREALLACYRIRNDDKLKRLRRPPASVELGEQP